MKYLWWVLVLLLLPTSISASTFYVSKTGNNAGGTSWATAWNELNQIVWTSVNIGDTILIDGGATACATPNNTYNASTKQYGLRPGFTCGMRYETTLAYGKSGTSAAPITIKLAPDAGRSGTAVIYGGRSAPLGYCGDSSYTAVYQSFSGVRTQGVSTSNQQHVILDGTKWGGITIYGHNQNGISLGSAQNNTFKNLEIYDNGNWNATNVYPDQEGVAGLGINSVFDRVLIHDNGQDAFQSNGGGVGGAGIEAINFTVRNSWLYMHRTDGPDSRGFNYCRHSDGIQIYGGGEKSGITIETAFLALTLCKE